MTNSLPPWLDVGPKDYLNAIQTGTQTGLEVARMRAAQQEAVARRVAAQQEAQRQAWEFGERMRQQAQLAAMEDERQRAYQQGTLDWHREQMRMDADRAKENTALARSRLGETVAHNMAMEGKLPSSVLEVDQILKDEKEANNAEKLGNLDLANQLRERAGLMREQLKGQNVVTGYDDQGRPIVSVGKGIGTTPTVATASRAQQKLQKYENAMEIMNRLQSGLEAGHVGIAGLAGEYGWDRGLVQLLNLMGNESAQADPDRVNSRSGLIMLRESLMREISDDSRFSNMDREEISKALPSSGAFESLSDAKQKLATVRDIITKRSQVYANSAKIPLPLWSMSPDEIKAAFKSGKVSRQDAINALTRYH